MSKCKLQRHILNTVRSVELYYEKFSVQPRTPTNVMYRLNGIEGGYTRTVPGEVRGYKLFLSCSTQPSMTFILLMNVEMPTTIVGILTF